MVFLSRLFALLSVVFASAAIAAPAQLEHVTLQLKWLHQFQFAGYYAAKEQGYYQQEGLDVTIKQRTPHTNLIKSVTSGRANYGISGMGILARYANGTPIKALAAVFQHDALVFISKANSGIISPYEMAGKRLMFDSSTGNDVLLNALLADANLTKKDLTLVPQSMGVQSLMDGKVDILTAYSTDQPFEFHQMHVPINIINPQNYGFDFYGDILFTSQKELQMHPGRAERFRRASIKGWVYALAHPEEIIKLIKNKYHSRSSLARLRFEAKQTRKLILPNVIPVGNMEISRLRRISDIYSQLHMAPKLNDEQLNQFIFHRSTKIKLTPTEQAWLDAHPTIRVGVDADFAPYEWIDKKGHYVGLAADYIHLVEKRLGVKFEIVHDKPWYQLLAMAYRGELDMLSCLNKTPGRSRHLSFTQPYVTNPVVIVNANRHGYIGSLDRLAGKTVAVERGYYTSEMLKRDYPSIHLLTVNNTQSALEQVAAGAADAYVGDAAYANFSIKKANLLNLQFAGDTHLSTKYAIGVQKSEPLLLSIINKALNSISSEDRKKIEDKWMGLTVDTGMRLKTVLQIAAVLSLLLLSFAYWIYRLRLSKRALEQSEAKHRTVLNASPIPHFVYNDSGTIIYLNQAFIHTFGYNQQDIPTLEQWRKQAFPDPDYHQHIINLWQQRLYHSTPGDNDFLPIEIEVHCKNNQQRAVMASVTTVFEANEKNYVVILYDITDRKRVEEKLQLSGRVFNQAHEGILITDAHGIIVDINPAFSEITGYSRDEIIGQTPNLLRSDKHSDVFFQEMWDSLRRDGHWQGEIWNRKKNGDLFAELLTISTLVDEHGDTVHYLGLFSDITQSKEQQNTLEIMAHYDMLTQLPNRSLFADRFSQAIAHSNRNHSLLAVAFLDLDGFKPVNDSFGHEVGDLLLQEVAQRIKASIREDDTASRQGGDEFALLLNDISSLTHCDNLISRLQRTISLPYIINDEEITLSASIGVTIYPRDQADADTLLRHADQAMYQAKLTGRNRYHIFDAVHDQQINQQQNQLKAIQEALNNQQLRLFYQPKVNMRTGEVIGAEALLRWQHPEHGLLSPGAFLPALQGTELEIKVGNWVIEQALKQLAQWQQQGIELEVSINISSHHLQWEGFFEHIDWALSRYPQIASSLLQLEILESSILSDINTISSIIRTCRQVLGIRISLDDFGTGYSSLTHLRYLPVDVVKIDQSFVRDIIDDPNDFTIVDGVIGLTEAFHHQVIAEGVETIEHGLMLMLMGCDLAQGYVISPPLPNDAFVDWFYKHQPEQTWREHAKLSLTDEQTIIKLMTLQADHWLSRVIKNLESAPDETHNWPILNHHQCHFVHWVEQSRKQQLFDKHWLDQLHQSYIDLFEQANHLKLQYQGGAIDTARIGIQDLYARYTIVEALMRQYDMTGFMKLKAEIQATH